jgi:hypothetical protein
MTITIEQAALLLALDGDDEGLEKKLHLFMATELERLANTCANLANFIEYEIQRRKEY